MYGKLVNGEIVKAPQNYLTTEGGAIFDFNRKPEVMRQYGFKEIINNVPVLDENHYFTIKEYKEDVNNITVVYEIHEKVTTETLDDKVKRLQAELLATQQAVDFMIMQRAQ